MTRKLVVNVKITIFAHLMQEYYERTNGFKFIFAQNLEQFFAEIVFIILMLLFFRV